MQAKPLLACHANLADWGGVVVSKGRRELRERERESRGPGWGGRQDKSIMCIQVQQ